MMNSGERYRNPNALSTDWKSDLVTRTARQICVQPTDNQRHSVLFAREE